ncbi:MAG: hypothetical protein JW751_02050 [Polyangiaceae bacterium]|nr:hypothetical protein [Polyangiaceae bacterium]
MRPRSARATAALVLPPPSRELDCTNSTDDDLDSVTDCADADCVGDQACRATGEPERTDPLCRDWVDNDRDGRTDCDDLDCAAPGITVCRGSLLAGGGATGGEDLDLQRGIQPEALLGRGDHADGERTDELCSDGIDNDGDGRIDCGDLGCRFDGDVHICAGSPGLRFSVYASAGHAVRFDDRRTARADIRQETNLRVLQLRVLGPVRGIEDSFFVLTVRAEQTLRLTYASVRIPMGKRGQYFRVSSGGATLSTLPVLSASKLLFLEPASFLYSAFEQGSGAAGELGTPLAPDQRLRCRGFLAGGERFTTGQSDAEGGRDHPWTVGAQLLWDLAGHTSPWDSQLLYSPAPLALGIHLGARYDQRPEERFPAANLGLALRAGRLLILGEGFAKRELAFLSTQLSYQAALGILLVPRRVLIGVDYGAFLAGDLGAPPEAPSTDLGFVVATARDESQLRAVVHSFVLRDLGLISLRYIDRRVRASRAAADGFRRQELLLAVSYRF